MPTIAGLLGGVFLISALVGALVPVIDASDNNATLQSVAAFMPQEAQAPVESADDGDPFNTAATAAAIAPAELPAQDAAESLHVQPGRVLGMQTESVSMSVPVTAGFLSQFSQFAALLTASGQSYTIMTSHQQPAPPLPPAATSTASTTLPVGDTTNASSHPKRSLNKHMLH